MKLRTLNDITPYIDEFSFTSLNDPAKKDTIVILNPSDSVCFAPTYLRSKRSLDEHISYVREHNIKKALVVGEDIGFLRQCPNLEYLQVIPSFSAKNFDFSPLYDMPNIKWLECQTIYGYEENRVSDVDYSRIHGLMYLRVNGAKGHSQIQSAKKLKTLVLDGGFPASDTLCNVFAGSDLENLTVGSSPIRSLNGIESAQYLRALHLDSNRRLVDISPLASLADSLVELTIENCGKIQDFSILSELHKLERLKLVGSNKIANLGFIHHMRNLKYFIFKMNVIDGDLSACLNIPYVSIQNRKHYSHKNNDFNKNQR